MTKSWREIKSEFLNALQDVYEKRESESLFKWVLEHFTGEFSPSPAELDQSISEKEIAAVREIIRRLQQEEPIQYILGKTFFYELPLRVSNQVLIPRQETEELVHWILEDLPQQKQVSILDVGTGSGSIAIALAKNRPNATITAIDISKEAISIAKQNAADNQIQTIQFLNIGVAEYVKQPNQFDLIVSNPPYIDPNDADILERTVVGFEPSVALFAPEGQPLYFYDIISKYAKTALQPDGCLYFEINEFFHLELVELLHQNGFSSVESKQDLNGLWRMVRALQ